MTNIKSFPPRSRVVPTNDFGLCHIQAKMGIGTNGQFGVPTLDWVVTISSRRASRRSEVLTQSLQFLTRLRYPRSWLCSGSSWSWPGVMVPFGWSGITAMFGPHRIIALNRTVLDFGPDRTVMSHSFVQMTWVPGPVQTVLSSRPDWAVPKSKS